MNRTADNAERAPAPAEAACAAPCHEQTISETRAVEEALARLGPGATAPAVQQDLERRGVQVSVAFIEQVQAGVPPPRPGDLVLTEAEPVPPPEDLRG